MSIERQGKEPVKIVAALEIAQGVRSALADAIEKHQDNGWDSGVLAYEIARTLGLLLRLSEVPPHRLDELLDFQRKVYAGLIPANAPSVEEALKSLCPESDPENPAGAGGGDAKVLQ